MTRYLRRLIRWLVGLFWLRRGPYLLRFGADAVPVSQAYAGILATGGTGSGKSSSLDHLAVALLRMQFGAVIVCVKNGEYDRWLALVRAAGREADLVRVTADGDYAIDLLGYELNRPGGSVETTARLLDKLIAVAGQDQGEGRDGEAFFKLGTERTARLTLHTVFLATGGATFDALYRCLVTAPKTSAEARSKEWVKASYCGDLLARIGARARTPAEEALYARLLDGWLVDFADTADRTRSGFVAGCNNVWARFQDPPFADLLTGGRPVRLTPEDVTDRGKVVVLDLPVLTWGLPAKLAQFAFLLLVQEACLRRASSAGNPVFVWRDECQFFVQPGHDMPVMTVARSHRLAHVDIVQDFDVLVAALGGGEKARVEAEAFAAQHMTRLMFANANPATNEANSRLLGQRRQLLFGGGSERNPDAGGWDSLIGADRTPTVTWSEQYLPEVQPAVFAAGLRTGGDANRRLVDAILFCGGRRLAGGRPYRTVTFRQGDY